MYQLHLDIHASMHTYMHACMFCASDSIISSGCLSGTPTSRRTVSSCEYHLFPIALASIRCSVFSPCRCLSICHLVSSGLLSQQLVDTEVAKASESMLRQYNLRICCSYIKENMYRCMTLNITDEFATLHVVAF